jgi:hypothetical protein
MKQRVFPFEAKSTRYLLPGDFWAIPLRGGSFSRRLTPRWSQRRLLLHFTVVRKFTLAVIRAVAQLSIVRRHECASMKRFAIGFLLVLFACGPRTSFRIVSAQTRQVQRMRFVEWVFRSWLLTATTSVTNASRQHLGALRHKSRPTIV